MKVLFPKQTVTHKRRHEQVAEPVFMVGGKILSWEEAQQIHEGVENLYDHMDLKQEVEYRLEQAMLTREEARDIRVNACSIVDVYRNRLNADIGDTWNRTLDNTLYDFLHREQAPYLW